MSRQRIVDQNQRGLLVPSWTGAEDSNSQKPNVGAVVAEGRYEGLTVGEVAASLGIGVAAAYDALRAGRMPLSAKQARQERKEKRVASARSPFSHFNRSIKL